MKRLLQGELIGTKTIVDDTKEGIVLDETKNTFTIDFHGTTKKIAKSAHRFTFILNGRGITVPGSELLMRPEERIKHDW